MESVIYPMSLKNKCLQASRGIIIIDEDTWSACDSKPQGLAAPKSKGNKHLHH
jgi:hypothetical protein